MGLNPAPGSSEAVFVEMLDQYRRHEAQKKNPALLHTLKQVGGGGLASIVIACKTQRLKEATIRLAQSKDIYYSAWQARVFGWTSDLRPAVILPLDQRTSQRSHSRWQIERTLLQLLQPLLSPSIPDLTSRKQRYGKEIESLASTAIS